MEEGIGWYLVSRGFSRRGRALHGIFALHGVEAHELALSSLEEGFLWFEELFEHYAVALHLYVWEDKVEFGRSRRFRGHFVHRAEDINGVLTARVPVEWR